MAKYLYPIIGLVMACVGLSAQIVTDALPPAGFLVQLDQETDLSAWKLPELRSEQGGFIIRKIIDEELKILHLEHVFGESRPDYLERLERLPGVRHAQQNLPVYTRSLPPNDPFWDGQWNLHKIGALSMWSESNEGKTLDGTPIVVAVLEPTGFDIVHEDLSEQIWINEKEVPFDQLDNDENGYVDDYLGWNALNQNDDHSNRVSHGTRVAGLLSATNNNGIGVAAVGWNTKLLLLSGSIYEAQVIENYLYVLHQRQRFNETNGKEGSLVVATNASFGRAGELSPIWCAVYDELGEAGILSVSAADNNPINIDLRSDMPTSCASEYLITVTGVDPFDNFLSNLAYGPQTVDIAAPASQLFTTDFGDQYIEVSGAANSYAAPHVSGAIGLMYSLPFPQLPSMALEEPAQTALLMKSFLFEGARRLSALSGKIKTEARLDLAGTFRLMKRHFESAATDLAIQRIYPNPFSSFVQIECYLPETGDYTLHVYDLQGRQVARQKYTNSILGQRILRLDLHHLPSGIYQLRIEGASAVDVAKLVKMR
jgi:hypothetical protein